MPNNGNNAQEEFRAFAALTALVFVFTIILSGHEAFTRYFGTRAPTAAIVTLAVLGVFSLKFLTTNNWFAVYSAPTLGRLMQLALYATPFAASAILFDEIVGFPADINVPLPEALLFYPVMAYVVEIALHVLPITLIILLFGRYVEPTNKNVFLWSAIICVALIEPSLQFYWAARDADLFAIAAFSGGQVFLFTLVELYILKRYDFISMYLFRIIYYAYWHIGWGYLRLEI